MLFIILTRMLLLPQQSWSWIRTQILRILPSVNHLQLTTTIRTQRNICHRHKLRQSVFHALWISKFQRLTKASLRLTRASKGLNKAYQSLISNYRVLPRGSMDLPRASRGLCRASQRLNKSYQLLIKASKGLTRASLWIKFHTTWTFKALSGPCVVI